MMRMRRRREEEKKKQERERWNGRGECHGTSLWIKLKIKKISNLSNSRVMRCGADRFSRGEGVHVGTL
jgi:hypothetical protein